MTSTLPPPEVIFFDLHQRILDDPDFINLRRYYYSVIKIMERYPDGCPDHVVAQALAMSELDLTVEYQRIVKKLRDLMKLGD